MSADADRLRVISKLVDAGITLRPQDLQIYGVQYDLDENKTQREVAKQAMIQVEFPQRATPCEDVLDFLYLCP